MSKLQKFNNILFATLGSVVMIFLAIELYDIISRQFPTHEVPEPLTNQEVKKLVKKNKFKQTVSYDSGYWAWTENITNKDGTIKTIYSPYYIVPVSQITLENEHDATEMSSQGLVRKEARVANFYRGSRGRYNNVLIYNKSDNSVKKIFNQRILVNNINSHKYQNEHFLILRTRSLSETRNKDIEDFYIYKFADQTLTKLNMPELNNVSFTIDKELPNFLIRGRMDFDKNGKFDRYDPYRLFSWDFESNDIKPFFNVNITENLQKILDGRNMQK